MRRGNKKSKKRVATIVGWHGHNNAGDDGMLYVLVTLLRRYYLIDTVRVLCDQKGVPKLDLTAVKISPLYLFGEGFFVKRFLNSYLRKFYAKKSDVIVFGGGSIFHSENSIRWKKEMLAHAQSSGRCIAALALGVSFGPFPTNKARKMCKDFLCNIDGVLVRDKDSYSFATIAKPEGVRIALTHDLALLLPAPARMSKTADSGMTLGISINGGLSEKVLSNLLCELKKAINKLSDKKTIKNIHLLAFCKDKTYGDVDSLNHLSNMLKSTNIASNMILYNGSPLEFAQAISQCDIIIGMRLHSQVFAYLTQTAFLPITYAPKCGAFLELIGYPPATTLDVTSISECEILLSLEKILLGNAAPGIHVRDAVDRTEKAVHTFFTALVG